MHTNIEAERSRLLLTKESVASKLGISQKTYTSYVRGDTPIPSDVLISMVNLFGCSADYLLGVGREQGTA